MPRSGHTMAIGLAIPALMLAAAACGGDDHPFSRNGDDSAEDTDTISGRIQRNEMITALLGIGALPLHDIDETVGADEEIPNNAIPSMRTVIRLISLTEWDPDLKSAADAIQEDAEAFIEAAENDDHGAAAEAATAVHEGAHDFVEEAWDVVAPGTAGGEHADEERPEATP